jgi:putative ABC transport system substrate-binding protein
MKPLRRRTLLGMASLLAAPLVRSQAQPKAPLLVIADPMPEEARKFVADVLAEEGFVEGRNLRIEQVPVHGAEAESLAMQVIAMRPDVVFMAFLPETVLLQHLGRDVPIVFHNCPVDPVRAGLVASFARPGGNVTGTYLDYTPLIVKRWSLYQEVMPSLKRGAVIADAENLDPPRWKNREAAAAYAKGFLWQEREASAMAERRLGIRIGEIRVRGGAPEEEVIAAVRREKPQAVRIDFDPREDGPFERFLISERILSDLVVRVGSFPRESFRAAIAMLSRVLRGERPATIPLVQATRYVVKVNPRMAKQMGITIPTSVMLQAEVIEQ